MKNINEVIKYGKQLGITEKEVEPFLKSLDEEISDMDYEDVCETIKWAVECGLVNC